MLALSLFVQIAISHQDFSQEKWSTGAVFLLTTRPDREDEAIAKLTWRNPPVKEEFDQLNIAYKITDGYLLAWDKELYDAEAGGQRINAWKQIAEGKLDLGDVVGLGGFLGAVSSSHDRLRDQFGVTEDNCDGIKGQIVFMRELTLEAPDGRRLKVGIQAGGYNSLPTAPINNKLTQEPVQNPRMAINRGSNAIEVRSFGFQRDPLLRYLALSQLCQLLYEFQSLENTVIADLIARFERQVSDTRPEWAKGSLLLSQEELENVMQDLSGQIMLDPKWKDFKVIGSEIMPAIGVQFHDRAEGHLTVSSGPILVFDRPVQPKPVIKP